MGFLVWRPLLDVSARVLADVGGVSSTCIVSVLGRVTRSTSLASVPESERVWLEWARLGTLFIIRIQDYRHLLRRDQEICHLLISGGRTTVWLRISFCNRLLIFCRRWGVLRLLAARQNGNLLFECFSPSYTFIPLPLAFPVGLGMFQKCVAVLHGPLLHQNFFQQPPCLFVVGYGDPSLPVLRIFLGSQSLEVFVLGEFTFASNGGQ